jgi:hypothetical protein
MAAPQCATHVEFRIPISPSGHFYSLVRFFNFALRRLGAPHYRQARLLVVVGDYCDLDAVRRENSWSENFNVAWERVPDEIFEKFHWAGTANWRFNAPADETTAIILSDADTVLLRDIDPLLRELPLDKSAVRGHMAHFPPGLGAKSLAPAPMGPEFWPWMFDAFQVPWPAAVHRYSYCENTLPMSPAYFNLGFVALNARASAIFAREIPEITQRVAELTDTSFMRCQIAMTLLAHRYNMNVGLLTAEYNAANDISHLKVNKLTADRIRVLHFLRSDEISREELQPSLIDGLLSRSLTNPANIALQNLVREYRESLR